MILSNALQGHVTSINYDPDAMLCHTESCYAIADMLRYTMPHHAISGRIIKCVCKAGHASLRATGTCTIPCTIACIAEGDRHMHLTMHYSMHR